MSTTTKERDAAYDVVHEGKVVITLYTKEEVWDYYFARRRELPDWAISGIGLSGLELKKEAQKRIWTTKIRPRLKAERLALAAAQAQAEGAATVQEERAREEGAS